MRTAEEDNDGRRPADRPAVDATPPLVSDVAVMDGAVPGRAPELAREPRYLRPLRSAAELLVAILTIGAPLAVGGVHPQVMVAVGLLGGVALFLAAAARGGRIPVSPAAWALLGGALLAAFSVLPLSPDLVSTLSPRAGVLAALPLENVPVARLSLDPPATLIDLARLFGLVAVMMASAALASRSTSAAKLVRIIAWAGVAVATVSAIHGVAGTSRLYGFIPHPFGGRVHTPFVNPNHAASLMTLSLLACLGVAASVRDPLDRVFWWCGAAGCTAVAIWTESVGGLLSLAGALGLFVALTLRRKIGVAPGRRSSGATVGGLFTFGALVAVIALGIWLLDAAPRIELSARSKVGVWPRLVPLIQDVWLTGVGRGAFGAVAEAYMPAAHTFTISHPENFLLQWSAEWGVPATIAGLLALLATFWQAYRVPAESDDALGSVHDALLAGTIGVLAHDLADFGLEFAGVGVAFCVALGILAARSSPRRKRRGLAGAVSAMAVVAAVVAARSGLPRLVNEQLADAQLQVYGLKAAAIDDVYRGVRATHPADYMVPLEAATALLSYSYGPVGPTEQHEAFARARRYLDRAAQLTQADQTYFLRAWIAAREGRRAEAMAQIREAFVRGDRWGEVTSFALDLDATAEEISGLCASLDDVVREGNREPRGTLSARSAGAALEAVKRKDARRVLAESLLARAARHEITETPGLFEIVFPVFYSDAYWAAHDGADCDLPERASHTTGEAIRVAQRWLELHPDDPKAWYFASMGFAQLGGQEERLRLLQLALARMPESPAVRAYLAEAQVDARQPRAALETIKELVSDSGDPLVAERVRAVRLRAYWNLGQHSKALREAEEAVRLNPDSWWAYSLAASYNEIAKHYDIALSFLASGERVAPGWAVLQLVPWRERLAEEREEHDSSDETLTELIAATSAQERTKATRGDVDEVSSRSRLRRARMEAVSDIAAIELSNY